MLSIFYENSNQIDTSFINKHSINLVSSKYFDKYKNNKKDKILLVKNNQKIISLGNSVLSEECITHVSVICGKWTVKEKQIISSTDCPNILSEIIIEENRKPPYLKDKTAISFYQDKNWNEFIFQSNKTLTSLNQNDPEILVHLYYNFCVSYFKLGQRKNAYKFTESALALEKNFHELLSTAGDAACYEGDYSHAKKLYEAAIEAYKNRKISDFTTFSEYLGTTHPREMLEKISGMASPSRFIKILDQAH